MSRASKSKTYSLLSLASYPGSLKAGAERRAWYTLSAHASHYAHDSAIEATELKLEFSGIRAMSYEFLRRGGVAHKMDSNFSMLGAMLKKIDHWNAYEISYF